MIQKRLSRDEIFSTLLSVQESLSVSVSRCSWEWNEQQKTKKKPSLTIHHNHLDNYHRIKNKQSLWSKFRNQKDKTKQLTETNKQNHAEPTSSKHIRNAIEAIELIQNERLLTTTKIMQKSTHKTLSSAQRHEPYRKVNPFRWTPTLGDFHPIHATNKTTNYNSVACILSKPNILTESHSTRTVILTALSLIF